MATGKVKEAQDFLREAAEKAAVMVLDREKRREELVQEISLLDQELNKLRAIAALMETPSTAMRQLTFDSGSTLVGMAEAAVAHALQTLPPDGPGIAVKDLRARMEFLGYRPMADSTLYAHLARGKRDGNFRNEGGKWFFIHHASEETQQKQEMSSDTE